MPERLEQLIRNRPSPNNSLATTRNRQSELKPKLAKEPTQRRAKRGLRRLERQV